MNIVVDRLLGAMRFERDAYLWMDFNDRATGDALVLVLATRTVIEFAVGGSGFFRFVSALLAALVFWLVYSGLVYAVGRYLLEGGGGFASVLRLAGFAYPTLLLVLVSRLVVSSGILALLLGSVYFLAIVAQGMRTIADLAPEKAVGAAVGGLLGYIILAQILDFDF